MLFQLPTDVMFPTSSTNQHMWKSDNNKNKSDGDTDSIITFISPKKLKSELNIDVVH